MGLKETALAQSESPEGLAGRLILIQRVWGRAQEYVFLTSSQVMLMLLACEPNLNSKDLDVPFQTSVFSSMEFKSTFFEHFFFVALPKVRIIP